MLKSIYRSFVLTGLLLLIVSGIYPALVTGVGRLFFPNQAEGGLLRINGLVIGSVLIGQTFTQPKYFHPRPSAAGDNGYDATNSSGPNLGPTNKKLVDRITAAVIQAKAENPVVAGQLVPVDMVTASASGLDPHISPENARYQAPRVAAARGARIDNIYKLIDKHTELPFLGILGQPTVNVLLLNYDLDEQ